MSDTRGLGTLGESPAGLGLEGFAVQRSRVSPPRLRNAVLDLATKLFPLNAQLIEGAQCIGEKLFVAGVSSRRHVLSNAIYNVGRKVVGHNMLHVSLVFFHQSPGLVKIEILLRAGFGCVYLLAFWMRAAIFKAFQKQIAYVDLSRRDECSHQSGRIDRSASCDGRGSTPQYLSIASVTWRSKRSSPGHLTAAAYFRNDATACRLAGE